jgi:hypothetical protein
MNNTKPCICGLLNNARSLELLDLFDNELETTEELTVAVKVAETQLLLVTEEKYEAKVSQDGRTEI